MNNSIIKAKEKADKKHPIRSWWSKNNYKVLRVIFFPAWIYYILREKYKDKNYASLTYTPELCKKYLDKVLPNMVAHYCEDAKIFLISDSDDMGDIEFYDFWQYRKQNKKYKKFFVKFEYKIKEYILNEYEIDGYSKMTLLNWTHWDQAKNKFGWSETPYNSDYKKGVVFYIEGEINRTISL
jgi:hypothetical protein